MTSSTTTAAPALSDIGEAAINILRATHDGGDLDPRDLKLVEDAVNRRLNAQGLAAFDDLRARARAGYTKPWFCGIEHLTQDQHGAVYWRGTRVDHFGFMLTEVARADAERLAEICRALEAAGIEPTGKSVLAIHLSGDLPRTAPTER